MSKYKYEFGVSTNYIGSEAKEIVDLVDDWGYDESDLDGRTEEDILDELYGQPLEDFVGNSIESWVSRVDG
jgi:hypothetical protein